MIYPFITLADGTEITHSKFFNSGVEVYIEKADKVNGFNNMTIHLPDYKIENISGFSEDDANYYMEIVERNAHLILEFSKEGGVLTAESI